MHTIEVDFDVIKALMAKREHEGVSNNDVLRELLKLPPRKDKTYAEMARPGTGGDWMVKDARFPVGTQFRGRHAGKVRTGRVADGALVLDDGSRFESPSAAGFRVTGYQVNGWKFWEVKLPGSESWKPMAAFKKG